MVYKILFWSGGRVDLVTGDSRDQGDTGGTKGSWTAANGSLVPSTDQAYLGTSSGKFTSNGSGISRVNLNITLPSPGKYRFEARLYCDTGWNAGNDLTPKVANFGGSSTQTTVAADGDTVGSWQLGYVEFTVVAGDLAGTLRIDSDANPTNGDIYYQDELRCWKL